jgi:hypothetical protein
MNKSPFRKFAAAATVAVVFALSALPALAAPGDAPSFNSVTCSASAYHFKVINNDTAQLNVEIDYNSSVAGYVRNLNAGATSATQDVGPVDCGSPATLKIRTCALSGDCDSPSAYTTYTPPAPAFAIANLYPINGASPASVVTTAAPDIVGAADALIGILALVFGAIVLLNYLLHWIGRTFFGRGWAFISKDRLRRAVYAVTHGKKNSGFAARSKSGRGDL